MSLLHLNWMSIGLKMGVSQIWMHLLFQFGACNFFKTRSLYDLSKVTRKNCNYMCHLQLKNNYLQLKKIVNMQISWNDTK
jgi:hypothetical protein